MFPNLQDKQSRRGMTNQQVAETIGISRNSYESKKKSGKFTVSECSILCKLFQSKFEYLFDTEPITIA